MTHLPVEGRARRGTKETRSLRSCPRFTTARSEQGFKYGFFVLFCFVCLIRQQLRYFAGKRKLCLDMIVSVESNMVSKRRGQFENGNVVVTASYNVRIWPFDPSRKKLLYVTSRPNSPKISDVGSDDLSFSKRFV